MWTKQTKIFEQGDIKPMKYMKKFMALLAVLTLAPVSYTHLTLPTKLEV